MKTYEEDERNIAPDARDFLGGNYLGKNDVRQPTVVTLEDVREEEVLGAKRRKLVAYFRELDRPLILNKTNIKRLGNMFQTSNTALWRGQITLYVDDAVTYAGEMVGGIRVEAITTVSRRETHDVARNGHGNWSNA